MLNRQINISEMNSMFSSTVSMEFRSTFIHSDRLDVNGSEATTIAWGLPVLGSIMQDSSLQ